jgi:deoxyribodipyrimidine photo-lyase
LLFTSFKNKAEGRGRIRDPVEAPKKMPPLPAVADEKDQKELSEALKFMPSLEALGYSPEEAAAAQQDDPRGVLPFEGGEEAALQRLQKWMFDDDKLKDYFEIRNGMLGEGYSSKLSPWLALGCISPRRVWKEAQRYEATRTKNKSTYWLIFELTWRDFFIYMARSQGDKIFVQGGVTGDMTPWRGSKDALQRWKDGQTKDPLVDANMRELKATGFMSNRGRQNVASFLIFDLGVDWRYGAAHFEEHLLDYDPCSNWGNWVAAAGLTGQRVNKFNTKKQLSDYDPQRHYVNHWLNGAQTSKQERSIEDSPQAKGKGRAKGKSKNAAEDVEMEDADTKRLQARMERFGTGGSGYSSTGKGGRGGGRGGGANEADHKKSRRWHGRNMADAAHGA